MGAFKNLLDEALDELPVPMLDDEDIEDLYIIWMTAHAAGAKSAKEEA